MKASLLQKLEKLKEKYQEITALLSDPDIIHHQQQFCELSKEHADLEPLITCFTEYKKNKDNIESIENMLTDNDPELKILAEEELNTLHSQQITLVNKIKTLLISEDKNDSKNVFLEIRAGTGGHEAALFAGNLFRMYGRFAEKKHWQMDIVSQHESEQGGYKEIIARVTGEKVYSLLKFESGTHRVQRVPVTESQGRVHTSACTVAILPEADALEAITINPAELRIDTFRASGAGGQHVNKTDSAIRITHFPTGLVVECQDERSQHKNKARAMSLLHAKLQDQQAEKQTRERSLTRKLLVGSGDRSERIRTYNFPQGRVTDHRIHLTLYQLNEVMEGELDSIIKPLSQELQAELLSETEDEKPD